jgi:hypothetical protein
MDISSSPREGVREGLTPLVWENGVPYHDKGPDDYYERTYRERIMRNLKKKARALGYNINLEPIAKQEVTETIAGVVS